ncbi:MAG: DEAD/DEAH box helicase [FCB group bacterium]|nr:DEAD/DEAH box helicase [FCB group bacterium]
MIELRDYQAELVNSIRNELKAGHKKIIMALPTGAGKTFILADIAKRSIDNGHKVLALMHRRQLVQQMTDRFNDYNVDSGIIMSGNETELSKSMQIATIQTYHRRLQLDEAERNRFFVDASVVLVDEAHRSLSKTYLEALSNYEGKIIIGVTATPCLASGLGMGNYYDALVNGIGVDELIENGSLVPARYYAPSQPDLDKIKTVLGDYDKKELGKRVDNKKLIGDVFDNWARLAGDLQTIVFAVNVKHSRALCEEYVNHGVAAEHLDAHSTDEQRENVLNRLWAGDVQVVCNVGLYTEGFDYPAAGCIVLARPTKSMGLYRQMAGRGLRPSEGKSECVIIDHGGCIDRLGLIEDDVFWSLDGKSLGFKKKVVRKKEKTLMTCDFCSFIFTGRTCPQCGAEVKDYKAKVEAMDAKLVEVGKRKKKYTMQEKRQWFGMFEYYRRSKGYKSGWAAHKYREKFDVWPRGMDDVGPIPPDQGFKNYMKHLFIKWKKQKEKQNYTGIDP